MALASAALFGASTPASKLLLRSLEPFQLAGLLYLGAAIAMVPIVLLEHRKSMRVSRTSAARLCGAVLFGGVLGPVLLLAALKSSLAGSVSLLLNLEMVATAVIGVVLFHDHLGRTGWVGISGIVAASGLVAFGGGYPGFLATLLTAAACTCWGLDNHLTALVDGITPARSTLVKGIVASTANLGIGCLTAPLVAAPGVIAAALAVGAISYGVSIACYITSAHELGATRAQAIFASAPFIGAALAFAFLGEPIAPSQIAAVALLVPSIGVIFWSRHAHLHEHEPIDHIHSHRHDDGHHFHEHTNEVEESRHSHAHHHKGLVHVHPHWPDVHHRHGHVD